MDEFSLNTGIFCRLVSSLGDSGKISFIKVKGFGNSMAPFLRTGETIFIQPFNRKNRIRTGDIVAITDRTKKKIIVHRVISRKKGIVELKGDNCRKKDGWFPEARIIGIAVQKQKASGKLVKFTRWKNIIIAFASKTAILNYFILPFGRALKKQFMGR
jgi:signal peptidase I